MHVLGPFGPVPICTFPWLCGVRFTTIDIHILSCQHEKVLNFSVTHSCIFLSQHFFACIFCECNVQIPINCIVSNCKGFFCIPLRLRKVFVSRKRQSNFYNVQRNAQCVYLVSEIQYVLRVSALPRHLKSLATLTI